MKLFLLLMAIWASSITTDDVNILLGTPVTVSESQDDSKYLNDADTKTCLNFESDAIKWAVFDLQKIYRVQNIAMDNGKRQSQDPISIYVGNEFMPCMFHKQIKNFTLCKSGIIQNQAKLNIQCEGSGVTGQYVAIVKGSFESSIGTDMMKLCDIKATGILLSGKIPRKRPVVVSKPLDPITEDSFITIKQIQAGVQSITVDRYSTSLFYVNKNCQPIIWDKNSQSAFGVACTTSDGKGRITVFGKAYFLEKIIQSNDMVQLKSNLLKWLSPQATNPKLVKSESINSVQDIGKLVNKGDIVNFNVWDPTPNDIRQELKAMLLNGSIAMNIDHTFWVETSKDARDSYMEILNIFNVDFSSSIINWGDPTPLTMSNNDYNDTLLGIEAKLLRMGMNSDYFLAMGPAVTQELTNIPFTLLMRSKVRQYLDVLVKNYNELLKWICPCQVNPAVDKTYRVVIETFAGIMKSQVMINSGYKLPCIDLFPGDFPTSTSKVTVNLVITGQVSNTLNPTGYYLAPGTTLNYNVKQISGQWTMAIGCHSDKLADYRSEWYRYPSVYTKDIELQAEGSVYSPFGGVIWIRNQKTNSSISISLTNVVPSPFFNLRDPFSMNNWEKQKNNAGPWAIIAGDNMVFCVESEKVKVYNKAYLEDLMKNNWDMLVKMDLYMKTLDWKDKRPERTVLDIMTSAGYGHSGYPIVVYDDWFSSMFDMNEIKSKGSWGMCHEVGHNMQESEWTFDGAVEVTNNLMCLYNYNKLWKLPYYGSEQLKLFRDYDRTTKVKTYLDGGAKFSDWKSDPFIALLIYAQMANNFGFGFYKDVFAYYKDNQISPPDDDAEMTMWMNVTSRITGQNLLPMFDFWGFSVSNGLETTVRDLPCLFPDDFYRNISDTRTKYIQSKYKSCNGKSKYYKDISMDDIGTDMRPNFISEVNN